MSLSMFVKKLNNVQCSLQRFNEVQSTTMVPVRL